MTARSLWSVLMVAWLSAGSAPLPAHDPALVKVPVTEQETEGDAQPLIDLLTADDADAGMTNDGSAKTTP
jgi:hypothetical protein